MKMSDRHPSPHLPQPPPHLADSTPTTTLAFDSTPPTPHEPDVMTDDGAKSAVGEKRSAHTSLSTLVSNLPDGCYFGEMPKDDDDEAAAAVERVIWVEFPPNSPDNPFYFHRARKSGITFVAIFFTLMAGELLVRAGLSVRACDSSSRSQPRLRHAV